MVQTKEEKAAYDKARYEKIYERDKEKIKARSKARYHKNIEKSRAQDRAQYEKNKEQNKEKKRAQSNAYSKTPKGKKSHAINKWKSRGVTGDLSKIYDERYLHCTHCEVCNKEFSSTRDRHLDHCHETGLFRQVLCQNCNSMDNWKKYI